MTTLKKIQNKYKKIKILLTDVDGVLTDGGRYFSSQGEIFKKFSTIDGMGINLLLRKLNLLLLLKIGMMLMMVLSLKILC